VEWGIKVEGSRFKVEGFDLCGIIVPSDFFRGDFFYKCVAFLLPAFFIIKTPSRLLGKKNYYILKLRFYKNCLVGKEAAMGNIVVSLTSTAYHFSSFIMQ
jgi:hypothetical protein